MQRKIFTIFAMLASVITLSASELSQRADQAYQNEDYQLAADLYQQVLENEGQSADIYFNLGNSQYRLGHTAQSILNYERALRLDPTDSDARTNLEFVNERIVDKKGETGSFIYNTFVSFASLLSSNGWAILAIVFLCLTIAGTTVYIISDLVWLRKVGFFSGIGCAFLMVVSAIVSFKAKSLAEDPNDAIITSETAVLSTVPRPPVNHDEEAMLLHEGTKVRILRSIKLGTDSAGQTWNEVEIDNKHRAWINSDDIEKIWAK